MSKRFPVALVAAEDGVVSSSRFLTVQRVVRSAGSKLKYLAEYESAARRQGNAFRGVKGCTRR
ncbi:MAG: hypothetical protein IPL43_04305 [Micropruina sp.]|nr:hypothetical protein [Micropruina sp.]